MIPKEISVNWSIAANANPKKKNGHTSRLDIMLMTIAYPTATTIPPPIVIPAVSHSGIASRPWRTTLTGININSKAGIATRRPCSAIPMKCHIWIPLISASSARLSMIWAINTVAVRTNMVKPKPATAKGTAKAIAGPIP